MNASALALTGFMGWYMILLLTLATVRVMAVMTAHTPTAMKPFR